MRRHAFGLIIALAGLACVCWLAGARVGAAAAETEAPRPVVATDPEVTPLPAPVTVPSITEDATPPKPAPAAELPDPAPPAEAKSPADSATPTDAETVTPIPEVVKDHPAQVTEPPSEAPAAPTLADFIKAAAEKLAKTPARGLHAAEVAKERAAIAAFYAERDYAALWIDGDKANAAARAAMAQIALADEDGLDLRGFAAPSFEGDNEKLAAAEIALSAKVVAYGRQASGARVDPRQISPLIGAKPEVAEAAVILAKVSEARESAGSVLKDFNPPQKGYAALREKLAELRRVALPAARVTIPAGPELRVGMRDPRVSLVRARFGLDAPSGPEYPVYDTRVAAAVADFQKANGLPASGVLSRSTIAALAGNEPTRLENEILANMERWRWLPRDLGASHIEVNIPEFTVNVLRDGKIISSNRVIVGKPTTPTPIFSNTMQFLIVNPYWNVPQSIIRKEMLPRGGDPSYLAQKGFEVSYHRGLLSVRQPPGERNALGRIKFMFPNDYSVYLHDTPSRGLFASAQRAFSHGCVRVDQPFAFAETVLGRENGWSVERVKRLIGGKERYVYLPKPLPIHIEYFTARVDETGELRVSADIYGYSARVKTALGLVN